MSQTGEPTLAADAPATNTLHLLHTQLNGIAKEAVILEQFTLLGPKQRCWAVRPPAAVLGTKGGERERSQLRLITQGMHVAVQHVPCQDAETQLGLVLTDHT